MSKVRFNSKLPRPMGNGLLDVKSFSECWTWAKGMDGRGQGGTRLLEAIAACLLIRALFWGCFNVFKPGKTGSGHHGPSFSVHGGEKRQESFFFLAISLFFSFRPSTLFGAWGFVTSLFGYHNCLCCFLDSNLEIRKLLLKHLYFI